MHTISASDNKVFNVLVNLLTDTSPFTCTVVIKDLEVKNKDPSLEDSDEELQSPS